MGVDVPACSLPDEDATVAVLAATMAGASAERAVAFGSQQLLLQNRGLFDLLEARASARGDS
jgi:hypothetical protein